MFLSRSLVLAAIAASVLAAPIDMGAKTVATRAGPSPDKFGPWDATKDKRDADPHHTEADNTAKKQQQQQQPPQPAQQQQQQQPQAGADSGDDELCTRDADAEPESEADAHHSETKTKGQGDDAAAATQKKGGKHGKHGKHGKGKGKGKKECP